MRRGPAEPENLPKLELELQTVTKMGQSLLTPKENAWGDSPPSGSASWPAAAFPGLLGQLAHDPQVQGQPLHENDHGFAQNDTVHPTVIFSRVQASLDRDTEVTLQKRSWKDS